MTTNHKPTMRVLSILELISTKKSGYKMSEISKELEIPLGTLSPIIHTLKDYKYLNYDEKSQIYSLGIKLFETGSRYIQSSDTFDCIIDILRDIVQECSETCHFGILDGGDIFYLAKVDSTEPIRMHSSMGKRLPAYGTAIGKALLKGHTLEELHHLYPEGLKKMTPNTITDFEQLYKQIQTIEESGFAYECEESNELIQCIAIPLYRNNKVVAAISVSIPTFRYNMDKKSCIERLLKEHSVYATQILAYINI